MPVPLFSLPRGPQFAFPSPMFELKTIVQLELGVMRCSSTAAACRLGGVCVVLDVSGCVSAL